MSANKYEPHLIVLPEDDANAALVNGFLLSPFVNSRQVQVLPVAGGAERAVQAFLDEHNETELARFNDAVRQLLFS